MRGKYLSDNFENGGSIVIDVRGTLSFGFLPQDSYPFSLYDLFYEVDALRMTFKGGNCDVC